MHRINEIAYNSFYIKQIMPIVHAFYVNDKN